MQNIVRMQSNNVATVQKFFQLSVLWLQLMNH